MTTDKELIDLQEEAMDVLRTRAKIESEEGHKWFLRYIENREIVKKLNVARQQDTELIQLFLDYLHNDISEDFSYSMLISMIKERLKDAED